MGRPKLDLTEEERLQRRKDQLRRANEKRRLSRKRRVENLPPDKIEKERKKKREYYLLLKKNKEEQKLKELMKHSTSDINNYSKEINSATTLISSMYQKGCNFEFTKINGADKSNGEYGNMEELRISEESSGEIRKLKECNKPFEFNWKSVKWPCCYCHSVLNEYESLSSHLVEAHGVLNAENISLQCNQCKERLQDYALFLNHTRSNHHNILKLCCDVCNDFLPDYQKLAVHRDGHIETSSNIHLPVYHCTLCHIVHSSEKLLKCHIELCHTNTSMGGNLNGTTDFVNEESMDPINGSQAVSPIKCKEEYDDTQQVFQCGKCVKSFDTELSFDIHMRDHGRTLFECEHCLKKFEQKKFLEVHRCIPTGSAFECETCRKSFDEPNLLKDHALFCVPSSDVGFYKCDYCEKSFTRKCIRSEHMKVHVADLPFKCEICSKRFSKRNTMLIHLRVHTGEHPFKCETCGKRFKSSYNKKVHKLTHSKERPYKCDFCDKTFIKKDSKSEHMNMHTCERPFQCEICAKSFSKSVHLRRHKETHADEHRFKCEICFKGFFSKTNFMIHLRAHTGECFKCNFCPETFPYKSILLLHKRRHTKERPFKCKICQKSISTQQYLKIHMRIHSSERPFKCELCDKTFKFKNARNSHMIHRHSEERPHSCQTCPKKFKTVQEIRKHTIICLKRIKERFSNVQEVSSKTNKISSCETSSLNNEDEKCKVFLSTSEGDRNDASFQSEERDTKFFFEKNVGLPESVT